MKTAVGIPFATILALTVPPLRGAADPTPPDLPAQALAVLKTHCHRCHGQDGANEGGFNFVLDRQRLVGRKKVVPGDAAKSKIYRRLTDADSPMPPEEEKTRPSAADIALIKQWIDAGAADLSESTPTRTFVRAADVFRHLRADLERVAERDRRFTRYFTLTHLHNAGLSADELQSFRHGLAKLVNSLSWGSRVIVPRPIDPERTVFRIDLRDYQWNEQTWESVLANYPYGVLPDGDDARFAAEATRCRLPVVRADWFVATASRPPLYHDVLQLPRSEQELEKLLRLSTIENIRQERVARAGFNGSGVSRNNRLIERHEVGVVVYWKSYDFAANTGRQNLFAHPLGPGADDSQFQHDGGEIIFTLPNGLHAYYLADAQGRRLDKGPTAIVSDPKRPDRAVENGLSCMSCHARGMIEKNDQVRDHVLKNASGFGRDDVDTIKALYPPREAFAELLRGDAKRFQEAVARTGAPLSATEPVAALALRFESELDLNLAAAEAGCRPDELLKSLERSPRLAQHLGSLRVDGGTVQRQVFVDTFAHLTETLKLGAFQEPRSRAYLKRIERGDDLLGKGDAAAAVRAYDEAIALDTGLALAFNNRGLAHSKAGDRRKALADFDEALRLDPGMAEAYHNRGIAHFHDDNLKQAVTDFSRALQLDPRSAVVWNNRGYAHLTSGEFDKAIADFGQALRRDPKFAAAWSNRGLARLEQERYDEAIADFTEAIRLDPKFAKAYFNRGLAHEKRGDTAKAAADFARAEQLDPSLKRE